MPCDEERDNGGRYSAFEIKLSSKSKPDYLLQLAAYIRMVNRTSLCTNALLYLGNDENIFRAVESMHWKDYFLKRWMSI